MEKITKKKIAELLFDQQNINKGSEFGMSLLEKSLREVGAGRSVLLDKNSKIIAGNKTIEKAGELGFEDIIIVPTDGRTLVAVQRTDLDIDSADGAKMKILDNTVSKHNYIEDAQIAEAVCEEYELTPVNYGLTPLDLGDRNSVGRVNSGSEHDEWVGMPDFEGKDSTLRIIIHFESEQDREEFAAKHDMQFLSKGERLWITNYPFKEREDTVSIKYE